MNIMVVQVQIEYSGQLPENFREATEPFFHGSSSDFRVIGLVSTPAEVPAAETQARVKLYTIMCIHILA